MFGKDGKAILLTARGKMFVVENQITEREFLGFEYNQGKKSYYYIHQSIAVPPDGKLPPIFFIPPDNPRITPVLCATMLLKAKKGKDTDIQTVVIENKTLVTKEVSSFYTVTDGDGIIYYVPKPVEKR